jgi:CheY-specific phosphatase CheX
VETREIEPVLRESLIEPFISATCLTLREMAGVEAVVMESYRTMEHRTLADVSAVMPLTSPNGGTIVLGFSKPAATEVARRILAEVMPDVDEGMIRDCAGEVLNVIAGQAKALLHGTQYPISFATPTVVGMGQAIPGNEDADCLVVEFQSDAGGIVLQLCLHL